MVTTCHNRYLKEFRGHAYPGQSLAQVSLLKFVTNRAAFARPAPRSKPRYPASLLLCSPPTPLLPRPGLRVPLVLGLPRCERFSEPVRRAFAYAGRVGGFWVRGLRQPRKNRGQSGASQVTGSSSSNVPRSSTPPWKTPPRPVAVTFSAAFRGGDPLGFPGLPISRLLPRGPLVCLPTHQSGHYWHDCKAGYRPAGLGFRRAGFAPAGRQTEFRDIIA